MEERNCYVYVLIHVEANKVFYVGCGTVGSDGREDRYRQHLKRAREGSPLHVHCKLRKLLQDKQTIKYEIRCTGATKEESREIEKNLIAALGIDNLCNHTLGGEGGDWLHSPASRYTPEQWSQLQSSISQRKRRVWVRSELDGRVSVFESVTEAASHLGASKGAVANVARGLKNRVKHHEVSYSVLFPNERL